jgi:hypothetical protein
MTLDDLKEHLRDEHRLKFGYDYCWIWKYGKLAILSDEVWVPLLKEAVELLDVPQTSIRFYVLRTI